MLRSFDDLRNCRIRAIDRDIGVIDDLWFDDGEWTVRYLAVDTGDWLPVPKVLISPLALARTAWESREARVLLTRDQIKDAPTVNADEAPSRRVEEALAAYYAWPAYWKTARTAPARRTPRATIRTQGTGSRPAARSKDVHLHSVRGVTGCGLAAPEGAIGSLHDFIGDDASWAIRYVVADAREWLPDRRFLLAPAWIDDADWERACLRVGLARAAIEKSPVYEHARPLDRRYEEQLHEYYGRPAYWSGVPADRLSRAN